MSSNDNTGAGKNSTKKKGKNRIALGGGIVILIVVGIMLVVGPLLGGIGTNSGRIVFGSYNGVSIELLPDNYFSRQRDNFAAEESSSEVLDEAGARNQLYRVWRNAFEETVIHTALLDHANDLSISVSDQLVDEQLITSGIYGDEDGEFDREGYLSISGQRRRSNREYVKELLLEQRVTSELFGSKISEQESEFIKEMDKTTYKVRYAVLPFSSYPEEKTIEFATSKDDLFNEISLSRISIYDDKEIAESLLAQLREDPLQFEELAKTHSQDSFAEEGGVMGSFARHELTPFIDNNEDIDSLFQMADDQISEIIAQESGWFIYRIDSANTAPDFASEETLDNILRYIKRYERGILEDYLISYAEDLLDEIAQGSTLLNSVSGVFDVFETEEFPIIYRNPSFEFFGNTNSIFQDISVEDGDTTLVGAGSNLNFLQQVAILSEPGDLTDPIVIGDSVVLVELIEKDTEADGGVGSRVYYQYAVPEWVESEYRERILSSELLEDNFYSVFSQLLSEG